MFATAEEQIMATITFEIAGKQVTGLQAEAHFVEWALSREQESDQALINLIGKERFSLEASRAFQIAAYQDYHAKFADYLEIVQASDITITRT